MKKNIQQKRASLARFITRKAFPKYKCYIEAATIVRHIHPILVHNRGKFEIFTKRVKEPLFKITRDRAQSRRACISFIRRLAQYYGNCIVMKRKSAVVDGKAVSVYLYALVKV